MQLTTSLFQTASEIKRSSIGSRQANIIWHHQEGGDPHFVSSPIATCKCSRRGGRLKTERKNPVETTKLWAGPCDVSRDRWSITGGKRLTSTTCWASDWCSPFLQRFLACINAEGRQTPLEENHSNKEWIFSYCTSCGILCNRNLYHYQGRN